MKIRITNKNILTDKAKRALSTSNRIAYITNDVIVVKGPRSQGSPMIRYYFKDYNSVEECILEVVAKYKLCKLKDYKSKIEGDSDKYVSYFEYYNKASDNFRIGYSVWYRNYDSKGKLVPRNKVFSIPSFTGTATARELLHARRTAVYFRDTMLERMLSNKPKKTLDTTWINGWVESKVYGSDLI